MNKGRKPGLMGNEAFWRDHYVTEVSVGARRILRTAKRGEEPSPGPADLIGLTGGGFADFEVERLNMELRKAGFPEDYGAAKEADLEVIAARYTGSAPSIDDPNNEPASRAWVLASIARLEYALQKYMGQQDIAGVSRISVQIGRLAEWWLWRREGHDRRAVGKASSERSLSKARKVRTRNQAWDADWHEDARQEARHLHEKNSKRSRWNIAKELAEKYKCSARHMNNIIKRVVP